MWGQLPPVQNANKKNAVKSNFQSLPAQTIDKCLLTPNSLHLCMKTIFFFSSTRLFYSWIIFSNTFTLHICQSMCQHSWSVISAACIKIQPCQSPVLEVRSPTAASSQLHSTSKRKTKNFKEPYKWYLWQTSMKMPKQRHLWDPDLYIFF